MGQRGDDRGRGKHGDGPRGARYWGKIALWRIGEDLGPPDQRWDRAIDGGINGGIDEGAVWQGGGGGGMGDLAFVAVYAGRVEQAVDRGGFFERGFGCVFARVFDCAMGLGPSGAEALRVMAATLAAGSVPGGKGDAFVEEKQFGVAVWRHDRAAALFEREQAADPSAMFPARGAKVSLCVMQDAAIAHEGAARRIGYEIACWCNPVLSGHTIISLVAVSLTSG